jgi:RHS repeat-associated protein
VNGAGALSVAEAYGHRVRSLTNPMPTENGESARVVDDSGTFVYLFNPAGRHEKTLDALTGDALYEFTYDDSLGGRLISVFAPREGLTLSIERDSVSGAPAAIVAPGGQRTVVTTDPATGFLTSVTNPNSESHVLAYEPGREGLLRTFTNPRGKTSSFEYDSQGRLTRDTDAAEGYKDLTRTGGDLANTITMSTAMGRVSTLATQFAETPAGLNISSSYTQPASPLALVNERRGDTSRESTSPDGARVTTDLEPDARFGLLSPEVKSATIALPSTLSMRVDFARSIDLADPTNVFSVLSRTETATIGGRAYTSIYDNPAGGPRRVTSRLPSGREVIATLDDKMRPTRVESIGVATTDLEYESFGAIKAIRQTAPGEVRETRVLSYDARLRPVELRLPDGTLLSHVYDNADRVIRVDRNAALLVSLGYDGNDNTTSVTPPARPAHVFAFTNVDLTSAYTPPTVEGGAWDPATRYFYNLDRDLTSIVRPDARNVSIAYEPPPSDRLQSITGGGSSIAVTHDSAGRIATLTGNDASLAFVYDGPLLTSTTLSWAHTPGLSATLTTEYDSGFRPTVLRLNGTSLASLQYTDADGLLSDAGALHITRAYPSDGHEVYRTLGATSETLKQSLFGEAAHYVASHTGGPLLEITFTQRDPMSRILERRERILGGVETTHQYTYEPGTGRLTSVHVDGALRAFYAYDANGNRIGQSGPDVEAVTSSQVTIDAQDRLLQFGTTAYTYGRNGELQSRTTPAGTTTYEYDVFGTLKRVTLPDARVITYENDPTGRRITKRVDGVVVRRWIWLDALRPIAELDGAGNLVAHFVYADGINVPEYIVRHDAPGTYRLIKDHLGSVRLVVDANTGTVLQEMKHDAFGRVIADTSPGWQPFGFAGGLYDADTGLTRFGARDYDAGVGRWLAKDPIRFEGGDTNLYAYCGNDPVNCVDPYGLQAQLNLFDPSDSAFVKALMIPPGITNDVYGHGGDRGMWGGFTINGGKDISPADLARRITRAPGYVPGVPTRLLGCRLTAAPGYCQRVANLLDAPVMCYDQFTWYNLRRSPASGLLEGFVDSWDKVGPTTSPQKAAPQGTPTWFCPGGSCGRAR